MLEDVSKQKNVVHVLSTTKKITNFIHNHGWLLAHMRKIYGGDIVCSLKKDGGFEEIIHKWCMGRKQTQSYSNKKRSGTKNVQPHLLGTSDSCVQNFMSHYTWFFESWI